MERALLYLRSIPPLSDKQKTNRLRSRLSKYGLTLNEYNGMRATANYCCQICKKHERDVPNGLVVDHDDDNGLPRGLLCIGCNTVLGIFKDDTNVLLAAVEYLKAAQSSAYPY
jgi:hypothetical protein